MENELPSIKNVSYPDMCSHLASQLRWFCQRVEKGEICSIKTYNQYKQTLKYFDMFMEYQMQESHN